MCLCLFLVTKLACASKHLGVVFSIIKIFKEYSEKNVYSHGGYSLFKFFNGYTARLSGGKSLCQVFLMKVFMVT